MNEIRLIIAGSRDFNNFDVLETEVDKFLVDLFRSYEQLDIEIVSGGARGADKLGEQYAKERNLPIKQFIPDWSIGKSAGYIRNEEMAKYSNYCICFWDQTSRGTKHMIDIAKRYKLGWRVVNV